MLSKTFLSRFRSRSSPERLLDEIETLSSANPEQLSRLRALSKDEDPRVRLAAARHIGLRDQLCKMLVNESDPEVRSALISDLFTNIDDATARETAALLVRHTPEADAQRKLILDVPAAQAVSVLIQQSAQPELAIDIASSHRIAAVRLAAADLVSDPDQLQLLSRTARDKSVQQSVRARLRALREKQAESVEIADKVDRLISASAKLVESADTVDYAARVQGLQTQFTALNAEMDNDQRHVIERNLQRCKARAETEMATEQTPQATPPTPAAVEYTAEAAAEPAPIPELEDVDLDARRALVQSLDESIKTLDFQQPEQLDAYISAAQSQWDALTNSAVDSSLALQFDALTGRAQAARNCHHRLTQHADAIEALLANDINADTPREDISATQDQLAEWFAELEWPHGITPPDTLSRLLSHGQALAAELKSRDKAVAELGRKVDRLVYRLRGQVQRKQLKTALHTERDITALLPQLPTQQANAAERKLSATRDSLKQLRDWDDFSARPKREALCEKMEALDSNRLAPDAQAEAVKALRQEWRTLSTVPLDEQDPLRLRFQSAADAAFAHCAEWHERQQDKRRQNLAERQRLVTELQQFVDAADWENPDLDVLNRAMRASRDEWRHYYPVRHSDARECQKQFDRLMERIHKAIKRGHKQNANAREALITEAESLLESADLDAAIGRAIELQAAWKDVGPIAARAQRQQWNRFRTPMDALFAKRKEERNDAKAESNAKVAAVRDVISELRALAEDGNQALSQRLRAAEDLRETLTPQIDALPRRDATQLARDADAQLERLRDAQRDEPRQRRIAHLTELSDVASECMDLEAAHRLGDSADAEPIRATLTDRLGENTTARALIEQRLDALASPYDAQLAQQQSEALAASLIEIEILADLPTPEAWRAERRACQIEMLEDRGNQPEDTAEAVYALCVTALAAGPLADPDSTDGTPAIEADARWQAILGAANNWLARG